jgi:hypothetical protein
VHLSGDNGAGQDTATDGDLAGEGTLLVDVGAINGGLGGTETQTNILIPSSGAGVLARAAGLVVVEDVRLQRRELVTWKTLVSRWLRYVYLLLESALRLDSVNLN